MGEAGAAWQRQCGRHFERPAKYVSLQPAGDHRCVRRLVWNRKTVRSAKSALPVNPGTEAADVPKPQ